MKIEVHNEFPFENPNKWDDLVSENNLYNRSDFLKIIFKSNIEDSKILFGTVTDEDKLIGTCVWSVFNVNLDLMVDEPWLQKILKKTASFSKVKMLVLGTPISLGQSNLCIPQGSENEKKVWNLILDKSNDLAQELGVSMLCAKEFKADEINGEYLEKNGFLEANSLPFYTLDLKWDTYSQYLKSLKHSYRRNINKSLTKLSETAQGWYDEPTKGDFNELYFDSIRNICTDELHNLYLSVISRAEVVLEVLPKAFFENLKSNLGEDIQCICFKHKGDLISAALVWPSKDALHWMLLGRSNDSNNLDTYKNTLNAVISLAIHMGKKRVYLGQTSSHIKRQVGGVPTDVKLWMKSKKPLVQYLLRVLLNKIFPEYNEKAYNVFKST